MVCYCRHQLMCTLLVPDDTDDADIAVYPLYLELINLVIFYEQVSAVFINVDITEI